LYTVISLFSSSLLYVVHLPFFIVPLIVHAPVYMMARYGAKLVEDEEETQAQNKVVFGLLLVLLIYTTAFIFLWALLWYSPIGAIVAAGALYLLGMYHNRMINGKHYFSAIHCAPRLTPIQTTMNTPSVSSLPGASLSVSGHPRNGIFP
jgi:glycerol-3-phosphate O-acyltransferase / dihydroxyacetone phosphate acyltransferase